MLLVESCLFDFEEDEIKWTDRYKFSDEVGFIDVEQVSSENEEIENSLDISHNWVIANKPVAAKRNFNGKRSDSRDDDLIFDFE